MPAPHNCLGQWLRWQHQDVHQDSWLHLTRCQISFCGNFFHYYHYRFGDVPHKAIIFPISLQHLPAWNIFRVDLMQNRHLVVLLLYCINTSSRWSLLLIALLLVTVPAILASGWLSLAIHPRLKHPEPAIKEGRRRVSLPGSVTMLAMLQICLTTHFSLLAHNPPIS